MTAKRVRETHAAGVLELAERILVPGESAPDSGGCNALLLQASFLVRLASALLLEPDFPALPDGFQRLLDRDRARLAARQLDRSRLAWCRSFSRHATEPTPRDRAGLPREEIDYRLAAQTAATLQDLHSVRRDLFGEYLDWTSRDDERQSRPHPELRAATLALLNAYWRSGRRLLRLETASTQKPSHRGVPARLRRPLWENEITWELWSSLDPRFLLWSDPLPATSDPLLLSQQLWPLVATTLACRNNPVK